MKSSADKVQVIVLARRPTVQVLLLRRPPERQSIWQPVTGKVEPTDRNPVTAARRELFEETGIGQVESLRDVDYEITFTARSRLIRERVVLAELARPCPVALSEEHVEYAWLSPTLAMERLAWESNRRALEIALGIFTGPFPPAEPGEPPKP